MAVDSAPKRMSATIFLVPSMTGFWPGTSGVSAAERLAVTWMYGGIASGPPGSANRRRGLLLGVYP